VDCLPIDRRMWIIRMNSDRMSVKLERERVNAPYHKTRHKLQLFRYFFGTMREVRCSQLHGIPLVFNIDTIAKLSWNVTDYSCGSRN
jgi:hypothetical protein